MPERARADLSLGASGEQPVGATGPYSAVLKLMLSAIGLHPSYQVPIVSPHVGSLFNLVTLSLPARKGRHWP
jgi:hypothetical protein